MHSIFIFWILVLSYALPMFIRYRFFFVKQKTAYELRISDWSSDVCSSDLDRPAHLPPPQEQGCRGLSTAPSTGQQVAEQPHRRIRFAPCVGRQAPGRDRQCPGAFADQREAIAGKDEVPFHRLGPAARRGFPQRQRRGGIGQAVEPRHVGRSEGHTAEPPVTNAPLV